MVTARVPATSANLGPGFDLLGLALPLYNRLTLAEAERFEIVNHGPEAAGLPTHERHMAYRAAKALCECIGKPVPTWRLEMEVNIPQSRGLGSSSAAIVSGLVAANGWFGSPLDTEALLSIATQIEGHPDNVGPALYGGVTAAFTQDNVTRCLVLAKSAPTALVLAVPDFKLSTAEARRALPAQYGRSDVVANLASVTILTTVMLTGAVEWLPYGLNDRIHQPYRLPLIKGAEAVTHAARAAGAWGAVISGAGPTLLAMVPPTAAEAVAEAMTAAWRAEGVASRSLVFTALASGACIEPPG
ncbi:MAG: thrB [Cyanobacteria bacterium RYN_339]|nr:thrB [Cyanobacteria bacterium RYN_339]